MANLVNRRDPNKALMSNKAANERGVQFVTSLQGMQRAIISTNKPNTFFTQDRTVKAYVMGLAEWGAARVVSIGQGQEMVFEIDPQLLRKQPLQPNTRPIDTRMVNALIQQDPKRAAYKKELQEIAAKVRLTLAGQ